MPLSGERNNLSRLRVPACAEKPMSEAAKNSEFRGTERCEENERESEFPRDSRSLESTKGDEVIMAQDGGGRTS